MFTSTKERRFSSLFRGAIMVVLTAFITTSVMPSQRVYAQALNLPVPGSMVKMTSQFLPPIIKGIKIDPNNPLAFNFLIDPGQNSMNMDQKKDSYHKLISYFLASLTTSEKDMWVNLSPYEGNRIIPSNFAATEMGRDMLGQDYILKQLTASLVYPEDELGKKFWNKIYDRARAEGVKDVPVNTFNKVWIMPDKATIFEKGNVAMIVDSHLKVMMEEDYLSLDKNANSQKMGLSGLDSQVKQVNRSSSEVVRQIVLPAIEKEVNEGQNFLQLRQMYQSMILASWFKQRLIMHLLSKVYVNKNRTAGEGVELQNPKDNDQIYQRYLQAFKKGVYNYIKEEPDPLSGQMIPRKYFSGGALATQPNPFNRVPGFTTTGNPAMIESTTQQLNLDNAMVVLNVAGKTLKVEDQAGRTFNEEAGVQSALRSYLRKLSRFNRDQVEVVLGNVQGAIDAMNDNTKEAKLEDVRKQFTDADKLATDAENDYNVVATKAKLLAFPANKKAAATAAKEAAKLRTKADNAKAKMEAAELKRVPFQEQVGKFAVKIATTGNTSDPVVREALRKELEKIVDAYITAEQKNILAANPSADLIQMKVTATNDIFGNIQNLLANSEADVNAAKLPSLSDKLVEKQLALAQAGAVLWELVESLKAPANKISALDADFNAKSAAYAAVKGTGTPDEATKKTEAEDAAKALKAAQRIVDGINTKIQDAQKAFVRAKNAADKAEKDHIAAGGTKDKLIADVKQELDDANKALAQAQADYTAAGQALAVATAAGVTDVLALQKAVDLASDELDKAKDAVKTAIDNVNALTPEGAALRKATAEANVAAKLSAEADAQYKAAEVADAAAQKNVVSLTAAAERADILAVHLRGIADTYKTKRASKVKTAAEDAANKAESQVKRAKTVLQKAIDNQVLTAAALVKAKANADTLKTAATAAEAARAAAEGAAANASKVSPTSATAAFATAGASALNAAKKAIVNAGNKLFGDNWKRNVVIASVILIVGAIIGYLSSLIGHPVSLDQLVPAVTNAIPAVTNVVAPVVTGVVLPVLTNGAVAPTNMAMVVNGKNVKVSNDAERTFNEQAGVKVAVRSYFRKVSRLSRDQVEVVLGNVQGAIDAMNDNTLEAKLEDVRKQFADADKLATDAESEYNKAATKAKLIRTKANIAASKAAAKAATGLRTKADNAKAKMEAAEFKRVPFQEQVGKFAVKITTAENTSDPVVREALRKELEGIVDAYITAEQKNILAANPSADLIKMKVDTTNAIFGNIQNLLANSEADVNAAKLPSLSDKLVEKQLALAQAGAVLWELVESLKAPANKISALDADFNAKSAAYAAVKGTGTPDEATKKTEAEDAAKALKAAQRIVDGINTKIQDAQKAFVRAKNAADKAEKDHIAAGGTKDKLIADVKQELDDANKALAQAQADYTAAGQALAVATAAGVTDVLALQKAVDLASDNVDEANDAVKAAIDNVNAFTPEGAALRKATAEANVAAKLSAEADKQLKAAEAADAAAQKSVVSLTAAAERADILAVHLRSIADGYKTKRASKAKTAAEAAAKTAESQAKAAKTRLQKAIDNQKLTAAVLVKAKADADALKVAATAAEAARAAAEAAAANATKVSPASAAAAVAAAGASALAGAQKAVVNAANKLFGDSWKRNAVVATVILIIGAILGALFGVHFNGQAPSQVAPQQGPPGLGLNATNGLNPTNAVLNPTNAVLNPTNPMVAPTNELLPTNGNGFNLLSVPPELVLTNGATNLQAVIATLPTNTPPAVATNLQAAADALTTASNSVPTTVGPATNTANSLLTASNALANAADALRATNAPLAGQLEQTANTLNFNSDQNNTDWLTGGLFQFPGVPGLTSLPSVTGQPVATFATVTNGVPSAPVAAFSAQETQLITDSINALNSVQRGLINPDSIQKLIDSPALKKLVDENPVRHEGWVKSLKSTAATAKIAMNNAGINKGAAYGMAQNIPQVTALKSSAVTIAGNLQNWIGPAAPAVAAPTAAAQPAGYINTKWSVWHLGRDVGNVVAAPFKFVAPASWTPTIDSATHPFQYGSHQIKSIFHHPGYISLMDESGYVFDIYDGDSVTLDNGQTLYNVVSSVNKSGNIATFKYSDTPTGKPTKTISVNAEKIVDAVPVAKAAPTTVAPTVTAPSTNSLPWSPNMAWSWKKPGVALGNSVGTVLNVVTFNSIKATINDATHPLQSGNHVLKGIFSKSDHLTLVDTDDNELDIPQGHTVVLADGTFLYNVVPVKATADATSATLNYSDTPTGKATLTK
ncbi:MAG: hypothetical protein WCH62_01940, partial [Candidatus Omnitrophota bacterium]